MAYDNTNSGVLFKNDRKEKDNHPDYKGSINIEGREYWLSSWIKVSDKGRFMSLAAKPKEVQPQAPERRPAQRPAPPPDRAATRPSSSFDDMDDDIPF